MLTNRFLNLLQGRLALMKRDVWALELAKRWKMEERTSVPKSEELVTNPSC